MGRKVIWPLDRIRLGFERFYKENGRLPNTVEINNADYLPGARQIQKKFGSLAKIRKQLGYESTHLGKGIYRTQISYQSAKSSIQFEHIVEAFLEERFGEAYVHTEKRVGDHRRRIDFYVFNTTKNFGVDVTWTINFLYLKQNVNVKLPKYKYFTEPFYIVIGGQHDQTKIDAWTKIKHKLPVPKNCKVLTYENFKQEVMKYKPHPELNFTRS